MVNTDVFQAIVMIMGCITVLIKVNYNAIRGLNSKNK